MANLNSENINFVKVKDSEELACAALDEFVERAGEAIKDKGVFYAAISGGHTPSRFYQMLAEDDKSSCVMWDCVQLFWVDERLVPPDSEASNYRLAAEAFIEKVPIPEENVHRITGELNDYSKAVASYERTIKKAFGIKEGEIPKFDLVYLGMGADGHIGSLFPNSYAHFDTEHIVTAVYLMDGDYNRITLTHPVISAAGKLVILVSGEEKAGILREVMTEETDDVRYPVHSLWDSLDKVTWIVDNAAAREII
jgi:6-phosphogluconolactonase